MTLEEWVTMQEPISNLFEWYEWCFQGHIFVKPGYWQDYRRRLESHPRAAEMEYVSTTSYLTSADDSFGVDANGNAISLAEFWHSRPIAIQREQLVDWMHANRHPGPEAEPILPVGSIFVFDLSPELPGYTTWFKEI